jgi:hypothetical protein
MFFPDPVEAFGSLRKATVRGGSSVFSFLQSWGANPWAAQLAGAAAGPELRPPGREPSGFAFADPHYMREIFHASGWDEVSAEDIRFDYRAAASVEDALPFFLDIGPAARVVQELPEDRRGAAVERMRNLIEQYSDGDAVAFPAAAWIWSARAN